MYQDKFLSFRFLHNISGQHLLLRFPQRRHQVFPLAQEQNPARWSGKTRNWTPIGAVTLNPERDSFIKTPLEGDNLQALAA